MITFLIITAITGWLSAGVAWFIRHEKLKEAKNDIDTLNQVNYKLNEKVGQESDAILQLFAMLEDVGSDRAMYRQRAIDVEDAIEKSFGITVRKEVTEIVVEFNKLEMVVCLAGIYKLLKGISSPEDAEFYAKLIKKVQGIIDKMPES